MRSPPDEARKQKTWRPPIRASRAGDFFPRLRYPVPGTGTAEISGEVSPGPRSGPRGGGTWYRVPVPGTGTVAGNPLPGKCPLLGWRACPVPRRTRPRVTSGCTPCPSVPPGLCQESRIRKLTTASVPVESEFAFTAVAVNVAVNILRIPVQNV